VVRSEEKNLRLDGSTNSGHIRSSFGGVGRNIADVLACLGADPVGELCNKCYKNSEDQLLQLLGIFVICWK